MATLKKYSLFYNEESKTFVKESTHKWAALCAQGYRFCSDEEEGQAKANGTHPHFKFGVNEEETKEAPTPKKARAKKVAKG